VLCAVLLLAVSAAPAASFVAVHAPVPNLRRRLRPLQCRGGATLVLSMCVSGPEPRLERAPRPSLGARSCVARRQALGVATVGVLGVVLRPAASHADSAVERMRARREARRSQGLGAEPAPEQAPEEQAPEEQAPAALEPRKSAGHDDREGAVVRQDGDAGAASPTDDVQAERRRKIAQMASDGVDDTLERAKELGAGVAAGAGTTFTVLKSVTRDAASLAVKAIDVTGKALDVAVPATKKAIEVATPIVVDVTKKAVDVATPMIERGLEVAQDAANKASPAVRQVAQDALNKAQEANPSLKGSVDNIESAVRSTSEVLQKIKNNPEMKSALSQTKSALEAAAPVAKSVVSGTAKVVVSGSKVAAGDIQQESLEKYSKFWY